MKAVKNRGLAMVVAAMLALATVAHADVTLYSDPNAWASRTTGATTVNFSGIAPSGQATYFGWSFSQSGLTVTSSTSGLYVVDSNYNPSVYTDWGTGAILQGNNTGVLTITVPDSTSLSFYLMSVLPYGTTFTVNLFNGTTNLGSYQITTGNYPTPTFLGFTSLDTSFNTVTLSTSGGYALVDNITWGQDPDTHQVPEPASMVLLGSGLSSLAWAVRKRSRK